MLFPNNNAETVRIDSLLGLPLGSFQAAVAGGVDSCPKPDMINTTMSARGAEYNCHRCARKLYLCGIDVSRGADDAGGGAEGRAG